MTTTANQPETGVQPKWRDSDLDYMVNTRFASGLRGMAGQGLSTKVIAPMSDLEKLSQSLYTNVSLSYLEADFENSRRALQGTKITRAGFTGARSRPDLQAGVFAKTLDYANRVYTDTAPEYVNEYMLAFQSNPENPIEKARMLEIADWCVTAEAYIESQAKLHLYAMLRAQKKLRFTRERIEQTIRDQAGIDLRKCLNHDMETHVEMMVLSRVNRLPEALVGVIQSYLPVDLCFRVSLPGVGEMERMLSVSNLAHIKTLHLYASYKYAGWWRTHGPHSETSVHQIFVNAFHDHIIPTSYVPPTSYGWGHATPTNKSQYVEDVVAHVRAYDHFYKIFMRVAETDSDAHRRVKYAGYADYFRQEMLYIVKFIHFLPKLKKSRKTKPITFVA